MTTGNLVRDNLLVGVYPYPVGSKWQKVWAGADDPPLPLLPKRAPSYIHRAYLGDIRNVQKIRVGAGLRDRRQRKHVTMHTYDMTVTSVEYYRCPYVYGGTTYYTYTYVLDVGGYNPADLWDDNRQLQLIGKLKEKVQGSDFSLAIFLGEGHQTLRMIGDSAIRIAKSVRHMRRGDLSGAARSLLEGTSRAPLRPYGNMKSFNARNAKDLAGRWLELQYGWLPLLKDVEGGMQFISHVVNVPRQFMVSVSKRLVGEKTYSSNQFFVTGPPDVYHRFNREAHYTFRRKLTVFLTPKPPSLAQQLGLLDPASLAWELLPFSFVIDWFIPVGQFLEANSFAPSLGVNTWQTTVTQNSQFFTTFADGLIPGRGAYRSDTIKRLYTAGIVPPTPSLKGFGAAASWRHCANAVALLLQMKK